MALSPGLPPPMQGKSSRGLHPIVALPDPCHGVTHTFALHVQDLRCPAAVSKPCFMSLLQEQLHCSYEVLEEMLYRSAAPVNWPSLFQPDDFFNKFKLYLQIEVWAASEQMFRPWSGWVQSR